MRLESHHSHFTDNKLRGRDISNLSKDKGNYSQIQISNRRDFKSESNSKPEFLAACSTASLDFYYSARELVQCKGGQLHGSELKWRH